MTSLEQLITVLLDGLRDPVRRNGLIRDFQRAVWNTPAKVPEPRAWEILRELAYDLDFYVPDPNTRMEDPSYFGDEQAEEEIRLALRKLKEEGLHIPFEAA